MCFCDFLIGPTQCARGSTKRVASKQKVRLTSFAAALLSGQPPAQRLGALRSKFTGRTREESLLRLSDSGAAAGHSIEARRARATLGARAKCKSAARDAAINHQQQRRRRQKRLGPNAAALIRLGPPLPLAPPAGHMRSWEARCAQVFLSRFRRRRRQSSECYLATEMFSQASELPEPPGAQLALRSSGRSAGIEQHFVDSISCARFGSLAVGGTGGGGGVGVCITIISALANRPS